MSMNLFDIQPPPALSSMRYCSWRLTHHNPVYECTDAPALHSKRSRWTQAVPTDPGLVPRNSNPVLLTSRLVPQIPDLVLSSGLLPRAVGPMPRPASPPLPTPGPPVPPTLGLLQPS
jgi:hypothetical protein